MSSSRKQKRSHLNRQESTGDILERTVSAVELARMGDAQREVHVMELLDLVDVVGPRSRLSRPVLERLAMMLGRAIFLTLEEKRRIVLAVDLLSASKVRWLFEFLESEREKVEKLEARFGRRKQLA